jgi:ribonucleoside-diphosphate reductase alpha chain
MSIEPELTANAIEVLEARYLRRDSSGQLVETPRGMFRRVAHAVAAAEKSFGEPSAAGRWEERFLDAFARLEFLPNSPTLMNAGMPLAQLSACFVLPVGDSMDAIFDALKLMALIQQSGGGTGFSFSRLRPRGDVVASTGGAASGPVSFMRIFDVATENIRQGGKRRGANMGILAVDHPDIEEFIAAKLDGKSFANFNLSVSVTDEFMYAAAANASVALSNPRTGDVSRRVSALDLLESIAQAAWKSGDPGLVFVDAINRANPLAQVGTIEATNPCGEVPLFPYEACTLGSLNLSRTVRRSGSGFEVDWEKLGELTRLGVRFLDDVIEVSRYPAQEVFEATRASRKIGLGVMGFAELLILLEIPYGSAAAASLAEELMLHVSEHARAASEQLAHERGSFPLWERSIYARSGLRLRTATRTSIAPTGTISIIAGTSAGIEPLFALAYRRSHVLVDEVLTELNPLFRNYAREHGFYSESLARELARTGHLQDVSSVPQNVRSLFRTALELSSDEHLAVQAAFQKHVDNAVSKTINLPGDADTHDVLAAYRRAWELGLKGITVYRYGSRSTQVLELGTGEAVQEREHFVRCEPLACKL